MATPRKPGRRTNRRGTVTALPNGRFQARTPYFVDPSDGKLKRKSFTANTWTAAEDRLAAWLREWGDQPAAGKQTVGDVLDGFLSRYEKRVTGGSKSLKTLEQYRWAAGHVRPHLGNVPADQLSVSQVEKFLNGKEEGTLRVKGAPVPKPLSPRSVKALRGVLNQAFSEAVKRREVAWNPVAATDAIPVPDAEREGLTAEQEDALLTASRDEQARRFYALVRIGLDLGLRRGELLGLQWRDWDRTARTLRIERSITKEGGKAVIGGLKTPLAYATLPLSDELTAVLVEHERWQQTQLAASGVTNPDGWLFPSTRGGYLHPDNLRHSIGRLGGKAGIDGLTPGSFRHAATTDLARDKVDPSHRRRILRHKKLSVTDQYYTHLSTEDLRADLDRLASRHGEGT